MTARRLSIAAVRRCTGRQTSKARVLCRKLLDVQAAHADAVVLLTACYLKEENPTAAVQALRNLSGACQELPSDLIEFVFRWLSQNDPAASGLERVEIYEALIPCAEGPLGNELRRALGQVAMERARLATEAFQENNTSLWQGRTATTQDVIELLQIAAAYDPTLAEEAAGLQKQLRRKVSRGKMAFNLTAVLVLIAVLAAASSSWLWTWKQSRDLQQSAAQALQAGKFESDPGIPDPAELQRRQHGLSFQPGARRSSCITRGRGGGDSRAAGLHSSRPSTCASPAPDATGGSHRHASGLGQSWRPRDNRGGSGPTGKGHPIG